MAYKIKLSSSEYVNGRSEMKPHPKTEAICVLVRFVAILVYFVSQSGKQMEL